MQLNIKTQDLYSKTMFITVAFYKEYRKEQNIETKNIKNPQKNKRLKIKTDV